MQPTVLTQRIENLAIAATAWVFLVVFGFGWWWPIAFFLLFDLSALGYLRSPRVGAIVYNLVHNYTGPALLALVALGGIPMRLDLSVVALVGGCWAIHVGLDRALGYGLKFGDRFEHTHLGLIGRARREAAAGE